MGLEFDVYDGAAPNGALLATLDDAYAKSVQIVLNQAGTGTFTISRSSDQATAAIIAQGNLVKVRLTEVSSEPIFGFFMDTGRFDLISSKEKGGEALTFAGSGVLSYLGRGIMWSESFIYLEQGPVNGEWPLWMGTNGSKAGAILRHIVAELLAGGRPSGTPIPDLGMDFTYTHDSDGFLWSSTSTTAEYVARVGDQVDDVVVDLVAKAAPMVVEMGTDLQLHAWNTHGVDRTSSSFATGKVRLEKGVNIATELRRQLAADRVKSAVLVAGDAGFYGDATIAVTPVREGFATAAGSDTAALDALALQDLNDRLVNADSIQLAVPYGDTPTTDGRYMPGPEGSLGHFWIGDTITLHTGTDDHDYNESDQRVAAITIGEDQAGGPIVEVSLGSTFSTGQAAGISDAIAAHRRVVEDRTSEALRYAHSLREVQVVASLPTLPDPAFPLGSVVFLTSDAKLYRSTGSAWDNSVDGADLIANSILAGSLAVGSVNAQAIATGAVDIGHLGDPIARMLVPNMGFEDRSGGAINTFNVPIRGWTQLAPSTAFRLTDVVALRGATSLEAKQTLTGADRDIATILFRVQPARQLTLKATLAGKAGNSGGCAVTVAVSVYDAAFAFLGNFGLAITQVLGASTTPVVAVALGDLPLGAVYADVGVIVPSTNATNDTVFVDEVELYYTDDDIYAASGDVTIDGTGIVIRNGKLTLIDRNGTTILTVDGFTGPWADYMASGGVYNNTFGSGVFGSLPNASPNLTYWTIDIPGSGTISRDGDPNVGSGARLTMAVPAGGDVAIKQRVKVVNQFPRLQPEPFTATAYFNVIAATGGLGCDVFVRLTTYDKAGTLLTTVFDALTLVAGGTGLADVSATMLLDATAVEVEIEVQLIDRFGSNTATIYLEAVKRTMADSSIPIWASPAVDLTLTTSLVASSWCLVVLPPGRWLIKGTIDFNVQTTGVGACVGELVLGASAALVDTASQVVLGDTGAGSRATLGQEWIVDVVAGNGTQRSVELGVRKTVNAGVAKALGAHSKITAIPVTEGV